MFNTRKKLYLFIFRLATIVRFLWAPVRQGSVPSLVSTVQGGERRGLWLVLDTVGSHGLSEAGVCARISDIFISEHYFLYRKILTQ